MASPLFQIDAIRHSSFLQPEPKSAGLLEHLSRQSPLSGITPASRLEIRPTPETASSGIAQLDAITGGLPRGCLSEISGPESSGHTTAMLSALAAATRREEICALIDTSDSFDPSSAAAAGVDLRRLLWVRCGSASSVMSRKRQPATSLKEWQRRRMEDPVEQALRAVDLLLQSKGFGMVALDLAGVPVKMARRVPLTTWFRFRRAVENTPTILLVTGLQPCAESCATLSLKLTNKSSVPSLSSGQAKNSRQSSAKTSRFSVADSQFPVSSSQFAVLGSQFSASGAIRHLPSAIRHQPLAISYQPSAVSQTENTQDTLGRSQLGALGRTQQNSSGRAQLNALGRAQPNALGRARLQSCQSNPQETGALAPEVNLSTKPSHAELLTGIEIQAEVLRSRSERKTVQSASAFASKTAWTA